MTRPAGSLLRVAWRGAAGFFRNHGMVYSASVAFNLLLSAIPILFLAFAAASLLLAPDELPFAQLAAFLRSTFPYGAQVLVPTLRGLFGSGATLGLLGTVLLALSSFSATEAVHTSLAVMLGRREKRRFLQRAAFHALFMFALTLLTFTAILLPPMWKGVAVVTKGMSAGVDAAFHFVLKLAADAALAAILFAGGAASYRYMSPVPVRWRHALAGSLLFTALLHGIRWGFRFYVRKFSKLNLIYGSLFGIVCFIIVAYLFAAAYLFCASIIGVLEGEAGDGDQGEAPPPDEETAAGGD